MNTDRQPGAGVHPMPTRWRCLIVFHLKPDLANIDPVDVECAVNTGLFLWQILAMYLYPLISVTCASGLL